MIALSLLKASTISSSRKTNGDSPFNVPLSIASRQCWLTRFQRPGANGRCSDVMDARGHRRAFLQAGFDRGLVGDATGNFARTQDRRQRLKQRLQAEELERGRRIILRFGIDEGDAA